MSNVRRVGRNPARRRLDYILRGMIDRCHNPNNKRYRSYGGRGISVCPEWRGKLGIRLFAEHIGPRPSASHSVDRIDNNGNYEPGNVKWSTRVEQCGNARTNFVIEFRGEKAVLNEWARRTGISRFTIRGRLSRGWGIAEALTTPPRKMACPEKGGAW